MLFQKQIASSSFLLLAMTIRVRRNPSSQRRVYNLKYKSATQRCLIDAISLAQKNLLLFKLSIFNSLPVSYSIFDLAYCLLFFYSLLSIILSLLIAHCPLPIAHCLLLIAHCPLPIAHCLLPIAYCSLLIANRSLSLIF
jgi:hypothetical protein